MLLSNKYPPNTTDTYIVPHKVRLYLIPYVVNHALSLYDLEILELQAPKTFLSDLILSNGISHGQLYNHVSPLVKIESYN